MAGGLVITRRPGQEFTLRDPSGRVTRIKFLGCDRGARIRIEAPPEVMIERDDAVNRSPSTRCSDAESAA